MKIVSMFDVLRLFESYLSLFIADSPFPLLNYFDVRFVVGFRCFSSPITSPNLAFLKKEADIANHFSLIMKTHCSITFFNTLLVLARFCANSNYFSSFFLRQVEYLVLAATCL